MPILINDRDAADVITLHHVKRVAHRAVLPNGYRIDNHSALAAFYAVALFGLPLDRHIAVNDSDPALLGECDGEVRLGYRIHRGRDDGNVESDVARQAGSYGPRRSRPAARWLLPATLRLPYPSRQSRAESVNGFHA